MTATFTLPAIRPLPYYHTACTAESPASAARPHAFTREFHPEAVAVGGPKQQRGTGYWMQMHRCPHCGAKFWVEGEMK